jgi:membrane protein required for beta-lactamase induction
MGFIGNLAEAILITWVVYWILAIFWFTVTGQTAMAVLFLVGLLIPLSMIGYEYWKYRKRSLTKI